MLCRLSWRWTVRVWWCVSCLILSSWRRQWKWLLVGGNWLRNWLVSPSSKWTSMKLHTETETAQWTQRWANSVQKWVSSCCHWCYISCKPIQYSPAPLVYPIIGHVEAGVWLPADMGGSNRRQLPRRDPRAPAGPGPHEEPHHQTLETPYRHTHPRQLPRHAAELRFQPRLSWWLRHLKLDAVSIISIRPHSGGHAGQIVMDGFACFTSVGSDVPFLTYLTFDLFFCMSVHCSLNILMIHEFVCSLSLEAKTLDGSFFYVFRISCKLFSFGSKKWHVTLSLYLIVWRLL